MANPRQANGTGILAFHPSNSEDKWDYTRTVEFTVDTADYGRQTIRAHVHYTRTETRGGFVFVAGPGMYWISGVALWERVTPLWVVTAHNSQPSRGERE